MNRRLIAVGIAVALIGAALWYFPLEPSSDGTRTLVTHNDIIRLDAPFDVLGAPIAFALDWQTPLPSIVQLYLCGPTPTCTNLTGSSYLTGASGSSGTLHWQGSANLYYVFISSSETNTVDLHFTQPVLGGAVGAATLTFGGVLTVLGFLLVPPPYPSRAMRSARRAEAAADENPAPVEI